MAEPRSRLSLTSSAVATSKHAAMVEGHSARLDPSPSCREFRGD